VAPVAARVSPDRPVAGRSTSSVAVSVVAAVPLLVAVTVQVSVSPTIAVGAETVSLTLKAAAPEGGGGAFESPPQAVSRMGSSKGSACVARSVIRVIDCLLRFFGVAPERAAPADHLSRIPEVGPGISVAWFFNAGPLERPA